MAKQHKHLTREERELMAKLYWHALGVSKITKSLGWNNRAISKESMRKAALKFQCCPARLRNGLMGAGCKPVGGIAALRTRAFLLRKGEALGGMISICGNVKKGFLWKWLRTYCLVLS